jgi:hypothetical protein
MNIKEISIKFSTDEQCLEYIEKMRWPDGVVRCITCGDKNVTKYERALPDAKKRRSKKRDPEKENRRGWFYICRNADCRQQFSPTSGTIFHDTHLPLIVWFHAVALILNAKKGISAKQLQRDLGIGGYKTAWYLNHRIREVMAEADAPKLGGVVEIDETYVGGKQHSNWRKLKQKDVVMGIRERGGDLRLIHIKNNTSKDLAEQIRKHVAPDVKQVITDELPAYVPAFISVGIKGTQHETIRHRDKVYVLGDIHTNTIESAFSLFKRGIIGQFHKVSIKHMQRYLNEFSYRFNRRGNDAAFIETVRRLCGFKPLQFATLTSDPKTSVPF